MVPMVIACCDFSVQRRWTYLYFLGVMSICVIQIWMCVWIGYLMPIVVAYHGLLDLCMCVCVFDTELESPAFGRASVGHVDVMANIQ